MVEKDSNYIKKAIEAILFMAPKSVHVKKIYSALPGLDRDVIDVCIQELIQEYNKKQTSISIIFENDKLEMVIKPEFQSFNIFATGTTLSKGQLKTLAYIALNAPVPQSKIIEKRPYDHLAILKDLDLISVQKSGKKHILVTTKKFDVLFGNKFKKK